MRVRIGSKLSIGIVITLAFVAQYAWETCCQEAKQGGYTSESISNDEESSFEESASARKKLVDSAFSRELQVTGEEYGDKLTHEVQAVTQLPKDDLGGLESSLFGHEKLSAPKDVDSGLLAATLDTVTTDSPLLNTTLLDRMKGLLESEDVLSHLSMLDSFDWFEEQDISPPKSRTRRASEPYRYRRFQQPLRGYVRENAPVGTFVLVIPRNYDGKLEIVHPRNPVFRLNSRTGVLETTERLDYEKQKEYTLIVRDSENDEDDSPFYSHDVIVYVVDVNDNQPAFNMKSFTGHVNSRSRVGSPVAQLNGTDPDGGVNGKIGFTIEDRNTPFTVNPNTWVLETNGRPLDQSRFQYPVNMRTFDQGYPRKESPSVVINVNKANDPPQFSKTAYTFTFSEKVLPGVIIGRVMAKSLSNIPVGYDIVPESDVFAIDVRGELSLKKSVNYESSGPSKSSVITVEASELTADNPLSSRVSVTLVVTNDNENPTIFTEAVYNVEIDEDIKPGSFITTVSVTDCDCANTCRCTGSEMRFALVGANGFFVINGAGEIRTVKSFDYDKQSILEFMVTAQDRLENLGAQSPARAYVRVKIRDINNNAPEFNQSRYHFDIDEDSEVGHLAGVVQATDKDTTDSPLTYTIKKSEPKDGTFAIPDKRFGILTVASSLKLETESTFTLTVEASDGVLSSETIVEIHVADVNDNAPQFTVCPDVANVEENVSPGARVTVLKAEDKDRAENALVEYFVVRSYDLISDDHVDMFRVNNKTGELETAVVLDREKKSHHFIIVAARDQVAGSELRQVGYCQFLINIDDENDNYPYFEVSRFQSSVNQNAAVGTTVLKVESTDADVGVNAEVTYSIDGGNALFEVNSGGWVTVKSSLVGQLGKKSFTIVAENTQPYKGQGSPGENQRTTVEIVITDQDLPKFTQLTYKVDMRENTTVGTTVLNISAIPTSSSTGVIYHLADLRQISSTQYPFSVDHSSGAIRLARKLHFEERQSYGFSVNAHEIGRSELVEASVEITVVDVNDIAPIFGRPRYDATVSEDAQVGTVVIRLRAIDHDPPNFQISYEIEESSDSGLFSLKNHSTSVEILTNATFDREVREYYNVILVAKDNGNPQQRSTAFVTVRVLDENDSPPVFDSAHYEVSVPENTQVGQTVETVITRDKDYGQNARALFFVGAGNDGRFRMTSEQVADSSRGYLVIARPLDYEVNAEYNLTVVASDKKFSTTATITVKITDADDDPPYFERSLYNTSLPENTPANTPVLVVEATDNDSPPGRLVYSLGDTASPYFAIAPTTGVVTTTTTLLDREKTPVVVFPVTVTDGTNKAKTFVEVTVVDVNEPPYFPDPPYIGYVKENQPRGTPVRYVIAFDGDDPNADARNSNITYNIDVNSGQQIIDADGKLFKIDPTTGLLLTDGVFNLEDIRRNLTIHVRATDGGSPGLAAITPVTVVIGDVSEFPPKFSESVYNGEVPENAALGQRVLKLRVVDEDFTAVGHQYSITSGNYPFAFYIQPHSGEIMVAGILDYESKKDYNLTVSVSERSFSETFPSDHASVFIKILDSNDQPPVFKPKTYYRKISEDSVLGTEVRVVTCSDGDIGPNAVPKFSITGGNIDDSFEVISHPDNKNLGVVRVSAPLDREKTPSYTLEVTATDIGGLTDTATLAVELEDVNDSPPTFIPSYYEASIQEGVLKEQRVVTISVTDPDQAPNGGPFVFTLKNVQDKFQLKNPSSQTVEIHTKLIEFKREAAPFYQLVVEATDSGNPKRSAEATIFVNVVDSADNREPFDGSMMIIVYALNGRFPGGTIGNVYYKDDDYQVDKNEYSIVSQGPGSYFTVDSNTGRIRSVANIPDGVYSLNVTVREKSRNSGPNIGKTVLSKITVRVMDMNATAVQHAVALRFPLRNPGLFIDTLYMKLVTALGEILRVSRENVYVFSIAQSSGGVAGSPYGVDVWIAIENAQGGFVNPTYLYAQLETNYAKLAALGPAKLEIGYDKCSGESKSVGVCKNVLTALTSFTAVSGYYGQVPSPGSSLTVVGIDTEFRGSYEVLPEPSPDCTTLPCKNGGTCHDVLPKGYVCECPHDFRGPECQLTTRTFKRTDSYIWLEPLATYELSSISFEFMAERNIGNGLLLYQGSLRQDANVVKDFLAISMVSGFITVAISLGGRPASFDFRQGDRLDDGKWHHVELKRFKKEIRLIIDHCDSAKTTEEEGRFFEDRTSCEIISHSFENYIYLNGLGPLQIGGSSVTSFPLPAIATQSFYGCIRNIHGDGKMYDLRYPLKVVNAPVGCVQGCLSRTCQNEGYCESEDLSSSTCCTCAPGYTGCDCSERSPSLWYLNNSFSEYNVSDLEQTMSEQYLVGNPSSSGRQRRHIFSMFRRYFLKFLTSFVVRVRVKPDLKDAIFFRTSTSKGDSFSELGMKNKVLYYTFKFADKMKTITLPGATITDKKWHNVHVKRQGNTASLQLDYKAKSYGTTGGIVRLVDFSGGSMFTGGIPHLVSKDTQLGGNGSLGFLHDLRQVAKIDADFQGCTSGAFYNGRELDNVFSFNRFRVKKGCPCSAIVDCKNNGTCVDEEPPYCVCTQGFTGKQCEEIIPLTTLTPSKFSLGPGERSAGRHRMLDPVWICVLLMSLTVLVFLLCLLHTLPVIASEKPLIEEEAHDSIMAYQEHGIEETDATDYDINVLMMHSRQRVIQRQVASQTSMAYQAASQQSGGQSMSGGGKQSMDIVDSGGGGGGRFQSFGIGNSRETDASVESWIMERVASADRDVEFFPGDEMNEIRDEGKYSDIDDLSELEVENDEYDDDAIDVFAIDWDNFVK